MQALRAILDGAASIALLCMMVLTFLDVIGRTIFSQSITGSLELTELLLLVVVFGALPSLSFLGGHIVFDLLDGFLTPTPRAILYRLCNVLSGLVFAGAAWVTYLRAERTVEFGDVTAQFSIGLGPFHYMVALTLILTAVVHFALAARGRR